ncbi:unnamed protein product [Discula destructiva]
MPPKAAKRKAKAAASDYDELWAAPTGQTRKRTRLPASRVEEDSEKKASKQSPSWADWQKKFSDKEKDDKRQFATAFKQNVEKKREDILSLISQTKKTFHDADKEQTELLKKACADLDPAAESTVKATTCSPKTAQDSPLFKAGQAFFKKCRDLVAVHEQVNDEVTTTQAATGSSERHALWKADMEQAQQVVRYGAQYGEKVVQCSIDMSSHDEEKMQLLNPSADALINGPGQIALDMYQRSVEKLANGESTWGEEALLYLDKFVGIAAVCDVKMENV